MRRLLFRCSITTLAVLSISSAAALAQAPKKSSPVTWIASARWRPEYWNWFDSPLTNDDYTYLGGYARFGLRQERTRWSWLVEGAAPFLLGLPDDAVGPPPQGAAGFGGNYRISNGDQVASVFLKQGYLTFQLNQNPKVTGRIGRWEFSDGSEGPQPEGVLGTLRRERIAERLLGPFGFSEIGRSFDGVDFRATTKKTGVTLLAARATQGVFNLHGMPELDVGVGYASLTRLDTIGRVHTDARIFALGYLDTRDLPKADNRPAAARLRDSSDVSILTVGGNITATTRVGSGRGDLLLWGALQTGDWGVLDHSAFAYAVEAGMQWKVRHLDPWVRLGWWHSSGDDNPLDDEHGTFFQVLPTPRVYARFPFYNLMNSEDAFVELVLRPTPKWTIRSDYHVLNLTSHRDAWYTGGGAFEDNSFGYTARPAAAHSLAQVLDLSVEYRLNQQLTLGAYGALADPNRVIETIYPNTGNGALGFIEARWKR